jgi:uncharacterized protein (TIGR03435 family)
LGRRLNSSFPKQTLRARQQTPLLEALKEEPGLKLEPQRGPVDILVVDYVEEPSAN